MNAALARATAEFGVSAGTVPAHRGWRGQRWGIPVTRGATPGWLKLSEQTRALDIAGLWNGPATADETLPSEVIRPALLDTVDWTSGDHYYRAELWQRLGPRCTTSSTTFLGTAPELDEAWWARLRASLGGLRTVTTTRRAIRQRYLDVAMRRQLPFAVSTTVVQWSPAHADLHWSNVTTPEFALVDWERWGAGAGRLGHRHAARLLPARTIASPRRSGSGSPRSSPTRPPSSPSSASSPGCSTPTLTRTSRPCPRQRACGRPSSARGSAAR